MSYELFSGYDSVLGTNGTLDIEKNQYSIRSRCGTVSLFHFLNSKRILCPPIPTHTHNHCKNADFINIGEGAIPFFVIRFTVASGNA